MKVNIDSFSVISVYYYIHQLYNSILENTKALEVASALLGFQSQTLIDVLTIKKIVVNTSGKVMYTLQKSLYI